MMCKEMLFHCVRFAVYTSYHLNSEVPRRVPSGMSPALCPTLRQARVTSSSPPCPTCCTSRAAPVSNISQCLLPCTHIESYLWQVHIRNDHLIQRARRILSCLVLIPTRMILVFCICARVPGFRAWGDVHAVLRAGAGGIAREVPACQSEGTGHDG
jgi:hypothetical protein